MFKIIDNIKNIFVHIRSSLKLIVLIVVAIFIVIGLISIFYTPMYSVTLNGEFIGYTKNKIELQKRINDYIEAAGQDNVVFVDIATLPEYSLCLLKRGHETNDEEIFTKVASQGESYYQYYAIVEGDEEKFYVATKEEAEEVIDTLKDKNSSNKNKLAYTQVYGTELKEFEETDTIVDELYEKPVVKYTNTGYSYTVAKSKIDLSQYGVSLIKPVTSNYTITSRFGPRSSGNHSGLDIAAPTGTTIKAAAAGTVILSGDYGNGYGKYVRISHGNGVETLYAHCSKLYVSEGDTVAQGDKIAAVGSTGNSTGPHLHLEIRVNGAVLDPQYYLY